MEYKLNRADGSSTLAVQLQRFYKRNGHKGKIQPYDTCLWLEQNDEIVACVRLSPSPTGDGNYLLLKGLWVKRSLRGQGIGAVLLQYLNTSLQPEQHCYCLAYLHLEAFYQKHGYAAITQEASPIFLWQRFERYRNRGTELVLMKYQPAIAPASTASA